MEALLYFIIWAAAIFVMMRFGCGAHVMGHGRKHRQTAESPETESSELRWVPPETDTDLAPESESHRGEVRRNQAAVQSVARLRLPAQAQR